MSENNDILFDREVRAKMLGGAEPVSEELWAGFQQRLAASRRRAVVVLWWKRAAIAFSAAAAIAIGVFLFVPKSSSPSEPLTTLTPSASLTTLTPETPELIALAAPKVVSITPAAAPKAATVAAPEMPGSDATVIPDTDAAVIPISDASVIPDTDAAVIPGSDRESQPSDEPIHVVPAEKTDLFAMAEPVAKQRRSPEWIITAGGNIQNNKTDGAASRAMRSAGDVNTEILRNNSSLTNLGNEHFGIPLTFGLGVIKTFPSRIGIGTGVNYSLLPRTFHGTYTPEDSEGFEADISERQHFVGIPLNIYYEVVSTQHFSFHVFAGGEGEKLISRNFSITRSGDAPINYSEGAKGIQWSVGGGLGMELKLTRHLGLYLDPGVRYYFNCNQPRSIRTLQPLMFNLEAGVRLDL